MIDPRYVAGFFDGEGSIGVYCSTKEDRRVRFHLRTQLTQNISASSTLLLHAFAAQFGGSVGQMNRTQSQPAYNWQLNGDTAAAFLEQIEPYLVLKREQAQLAIAWQRQRPPLVRNERGHVCYKGEPVLAVDERVSELLKELKRRPMQDVLSGREDLVEVVATLKQVLCVKG